MYLQAALEATATGGVRLLYLFMLLLAIILIVTGCIIALVTLRNQRKNGQLAVITQEQMDRKDL
jgi:uncharacterized membrane protein YozB (DUF420 family)